MRLVAGQKYVRGPAGEIMPYTAGVEKIVGCEVFIQPHDQADSLQLPENENLPRFRGRRMVDNTVKTPTDFTEIKPEVQKEIKPVRVKPTPVVKKTFEAEFDLREDMEKDLKTQSEPAELE